MGSAPSNASWPCEGTATSGSLDRWAPQWILCSAARESPRPSSYEPSSPRVTTGWRRCTRPAATRPCYGSTRASGSAWYPRRSGWSGRSKPRTMSADLRAVPSLFQQMRDATWVRRRPRSGCGEVVREARPFHVGALLWHVALSLQHQAPPAEGVHGPPHLPSRLVNHLGETLLGRSSRKPGLTIAKWHPTSP